MRLIALLLLALPLAFHLFNDRNGEKPSEKTGDIILVSAIALVAAVIGFLIAEKPIIDGLILAGAIHFLVFDYAIVHILKKRGVIETKESAFTYLGNSYTDDVLRQWNPLTRLLVKISFLSIAIIIYVL